jgi:hypothetical protein
MFCACACAFAHYHTAQRQRQSHQGARGWRGDMVKLNACHVLFLLLLHNLDFEKISEMNGFNLFVAMSVSRQLIH